jgi:DNA-binding NarL/FixJ family response regulator
MRAHRIEATRQRRRLVRSAAHPLTAIQLRIIELIASGQTDKEIAARTGASYRTIRTHLERLYLLHGVHCRAELVARVLIDQESRAAFCAQDITAR